MPSHLARPVLFAVLALMLCIGGGCGPTLYMSKIDDAEQEFERAVEENARWYAPYEYHFARVHLEKAREEAAAASYEDALRFARTAEGFSKRAVEIARRKRGGQR
ncbi:MAG: DUF4398 domain-containing protein [Myxococcales bacterium]|nr:DUF4398 domain-containing protein [Myxococcales bacterium]